MERARYLMGTLCTAQVQAPNDTVASRALKTGFDEIARIERVLSSWDETSDVAGLNATAAHEPFPCPTELYASLAAARALAETTDGAYDPTIGPLIKAWDMHGKGRVPSEREIEEALERVGWRALILDSDTQTAAFTHEGMAIDLGGIGKGFALDHAVAAMEQRGAVRGLLNFGGEICAWSDGAPWSVSIADPADRMRPVLHFTIANGAVSTSGQSERGFEHKGVRYGHVLDAKSGRPVESTGSVTVIATSATQADALSTALLVMGRGDAGMFARTHTDIGVIWLEHSSAGLLAWIWNAPHVKPEADLTVHYMDQPGE
jgi:thiamine biosynthesis lipoprotein